VLKKKLHKEMLKLVLWSLPYIMRLLFTGIFMLSMCMTAKSAEERCVRIKDCPPLLKLFKEKGLTVLEKYEKCGQNQVN